MVRRIEAPTEADPLAARTFDALDGTAQAEADQADQADQARRDAEQQQADQAQQALEAGALVAVLALLKVARNLIARNLPEIRQEWTDPALNAPATAAIPLLRRHLGALFALAGTHAELAAFAFACLPLALGYAAALDRAALNAERTVDMPTPATDAAPAG